MRVSFRPFSLGPLRPLPSPGTGLPEDPPRNPPRSPLRSLPRQSRRGVPDQPDARPRQAALRYASWGWPVSVGPDAPGTVDLDQVHTMWSRFCGAPVFSACGAAFDVVEADGELGRNALARLDRLGVSPGPVVLDLVQPGRRLGFLVRPGSARAIRPWVSWAGSTRLFSAGQAYELPAGSPARRDWLRGPGAGLGGCLNGELIGDFHTRPVLPAAHLILGALALAPSRA
jgi:hypothetical protein